MLTQKCVLVFLETDEVTRLAWVNRQNYKKLKEDEAIKESIWRGDLSDKYRGKFWKFVCRVDK